MANQSFSPACAFVYQKRFISGHLAGLVVPQYLSFVDSDLRRDWLEGVKANQEAGKLDWAFEGEILAYDRSFTREEAIADYEMWAN